MFQLILLIGATSLAAASSSENLEWRKLDGATPLKWHEAFQEAERLATLENRDWRVPNINEIFHEFGQVNSATAEKRRGNMPLWSSTTFAGHYSCAVVLIPDGRISYQSKLFPGTVWLVSGGADNPLRLGPSLPPESPRSFWPPTGEGGTVQVTSFKGRQMRDWRRPRPTLYQVMGNDGGLLNTLTPGVFSSTGMTGAANSTLCTGQTASYVHGDDGWSQRGRPRGFQVNANGTILDRVTGLIWQAKDDGNFRTLEKARDYCNSLILDGSSTWRLPRLEELQTLCNYGQVVPAIFPEFIAVKPMNYWTDTEKAGKKEAWAVNFGHGRTEPAGVNSPFLTLAVKKLDGGEDRP